jgi:hypothetical protein
MLKRLKNGITITEALASIAVASVGLFAVLAVIPFAARQAEKGLNLDLSVTVGKNAFHDFEIRGMGDPGHWLLADGNSPSPNTSTSLAGQALVIDPLYITGNPIDPSLPYSISNPSDLNTIGKFPVSSHPGSLAVPPSPQISRLTLASNTMKDLADLDNDGDQTEVIPVPYDLSLSEAVFQGGNDLVFEEPIDKLNLPSQLFTLKDPARSKLDSNNWLRRQTTGKISWMVMLVPKEQHPHLYRAYFILFKNRPLRSSNTIRPDGVVVNKGEVVYQAQPLGVQISSAAGGGGPIGGLPPGSPQYGQGGGEFRLTYSAGEFVDPAKPLRSGNWLLLTQQNRKFYRWYQVIRVDNTNAPNSSVTLRGPDLDEQTVVEGGLHAIILEGVVAVYEKTIRIESESIWKN